MFDCRIKTINPVESIEIARDVRPDNVPSGLSISRASIINQKLWKTGQTVKIGFINGSTEQIKVFRECMNEWNKYCNLHFDYGPANGAMIRVQFGPGGSWSTIGTDALGVRGGATMHFGWVERAVCLHEPGHMLGLLHSHNSRNFPYHFNREEVIKDLSGPPNNWSVEMIEFNVLDRTNENVSELPWEPANIMNYPMPARWLVEGIAINPGTEIGTTEKELVMSKYPFSVERKTVKVGGSVNGTLPDSFDLIVESTGLISVKTLPRNVPLLLNGGRATLKYLIAGKYDVTLSGGGTYQFSSKKY